MQVRRAVASMIYGVTVGDSLRKIFALSSSPVLQHTFLLLHYFHFWLVGYGRVTGDSAVTRPRVPEEAFSGSCLLQLDPLQMRGYEQQQNLQIEICSIV